jgi:hypothetical protein
MGGKVKSLVFFYTQPYICDSFTLHVYTLLKSTVLAFMFSLNSAHYIMQ